MNARQGAGAARISSRFSRLVEPTLAILVVAGVVWVSMFFLSNGYLPTPFFDDTSDTFMDWYNSAYWVYHPGAYVTWGSVYPPMTFLFLRLFSNPSCYVETEPIARHCDHTGVFVLCIFIVINLVLLYFIYRKSDPKTAIPRAISLALSLPMLFALDRGNLIVPCFTFFILGHGRFLKSAWIRWLCVAISINFKPYLIITVLGVVLHRRWRWAEGCAIVIVTLYAVCYVIFGQGSPAQILKNIGGFSGESPTIRLDSIIYSPTYIEILKLLKSPFPIVGIIGSKPIETMEFIFPVAMQIGEIGALVSIAGAIWKPNAVPAYRIAALAMALLLTVSEPGGYAYVFLFFLVFLERWKNPGQIMALVATYALCIPWDYQIVQIAHQLQYSYLSGLTVDYGMGINIGAFVRPALLLIVEYGLVVATLSDLIRALFDARSQRWSFSLMRNPTGPAGARGGADVAN